MTKDELVIGPGDTAMDSNGGFLFGQLNLGSRPSFVILDEDARENVDVLLDTKTYARFAIREGVIVKNELQAIAESSRGEVALGLLISNNDTEYEIELCPPSDTVCSGNAHIVVLCQRA